MKLLLDSSQAETNNLVSEARSDSSGEKKYFIEGIFAQAETKNRNGRLYPKRILEKAIQEYQPKIDAKRSIGELNHPPHPTVNPERASHMVESLHWDGNNVIGKARILTTMPMGKIAKALIDEGVKFGVSTRGLGSLSESQRGIKLVCDDFVLNTIDIVSEPSGIDCFVEGVLEGKEWFFDQSSNAWLLRAEETKKNIQKMSRRQIAENKLYLFAKFLRGKK